MNITQADFQQKMRTARNKYLTEGVCDVIVREEIKTAWDRCIEMGVDPGRRTPKRMTDCREIQGRLEKNRDLLEISGPAVDYLYTSLQDARVFVAVSDAEGWLLQVSGDTTAIDPAQNILYTSWNEADMGNNPIGTSLYEKKPCHVYGYEHICKFPQKFSGVGAPIRDPLGDIIGAISMTHVALDFQPHTLAMIVMTAYAIEQQLAQKESHIQTEAALRRTDAIINTVSDGFIVTGSDGTIKMINRALLEMTGSEAGSYVGHYIGKFLREDLIRDAVRSRSPFKDYVTSLRTEMKVYPCSVSHHVIAQDITNESLFVITEMAHIEKLADQLKTRQKLHKFSDLVVEDVQSKSLIERAKVFAASDANILITGESGTGKDVLAQAIHLASSRYKGTFMPIDCGAIQKELFMSELFGYEKGAFTGGKKEGEIGKLQAADGGTVFLDEIGEMPLDVQPVLLRALEQHVITRVGGKEMIPIDVRVIAATNRDLNKEVKEGRFRQDLYYRLNIFSLHQISLRERPDDILPLAEQFVAQMNSIYEKSIRGFSPEMEQILKAYSWPGNVRELRNCIERLVVFTVGGVITSDILERSGNAYIMESLPEDAPLSELRERPHPPAGEEHISPAPAAALPVFSPAVSAQQTEYEREKEDLLRALTEQHWNITRTSEALGITRVTVYRKMKKFGIRK
ncbi:MAG: sigma 54-interacting transcriptional regulator [Lachnospiraceae bacterium]|nr:sigma 54-interacting transcriptional regulator [Lachnospiraceae bacterium]